MRLNSAGQGEEWGAALAVVGNMTGTMEEVELVLIKRVNRESEMV